MGDGQPRPAAMFRFMALVNGPDGDSGGGLARGFDGAADQQAAFEELRSQLVERLLLDGLPAWALLHLGALALQARSEDLLAATNEAFRARLS